MESSRGGRAGRPIDTPGEELRLLAKAAEELRDREERIRHAIMLLHVAQESRCDLYVRRLRQDTRGHVILEIIREAGLDVLRPTVESEDDPESRGLRGLIWQRIDQLYRVARDGTIDQRREAAGLLKKLGTVLAGDRRGKSRRPRANPVEVLSCYRRSLLRLRRARELLRQPTQLPKPVRIAKVAKACRVPLNILRQHLSMSPADEVGRPLSLQHTARIW